MKLTKSKLRQIIQEELKNVLQEQPERAATKWIARNWPTLCRHGYMADGSQENLLKVHAASGEGRATAEEMIKRAQGGEDVGLTKMSLAQKREQGRCP
jgi:hypothetical protein